MGATKWIAKSSSRFIGQRDSVQAHMLKAALEAEGVEVQIAGESLQSVIGGVPPGWQTAPQLLVPESRTDEARRILERLGESRGS